VALAKKLADCLRDKALSILFPKFAVVKGMRITFLLDPILFEKK
jgi:hypothetical protein